MKEFCIVGAGGFGREVLFQVMNDSKFSAEYQFVGFVDDDSETLNHFPEEERFGSIDDLIQTTKEIACFLCIGNAQVRKELYSKFAENQLITCLLYTSDAADD